MLEYETREFVEDITPEKALEYLASSWGRGFRNLGPTSVDKIKQYARLMESGQWVDNGEPIYFKSGMVCDGRHRLHAILLSHTTIRSRICWMTHVPGTKPDHMVLKGAVLGKSNDEANSNSDS